MPASVERDRVPAVEEEVLSEALAKLISWIESWCDRQGACNGFVVHRTEGKRMGQVHDTAWTQSAIIRGYGNLFRKSNEARWGEKMTLAADLLASRYDVRTGRLHHTGHEDERFQSLVSCALGVCALLSVADLVDGRRRDAYVRLAAEHARRYWLDVLWVEREGAFKFTETDFYSPGENRFVVNFNTMAAEALIALYRATGEVMFRERALRVGEWLLERWAHTQEFNAVLLAGKVTVAEDPTSPWMAPGGFSYQFTDSKRDPDNYVTLYTGLSLRGFKALFDETGDERFAEIIRAQAGYALAMREPTTRLFYHTAWGGRVEKNPQFIAGAGMTLSGLHEVMPLIGAAAIPVDTVEVILQRAYVNGAYPGFIGKNDTGRPKRDGGGVVWEDVAASTNWNAQWFEYLTRLVAEPASIAVPPCTGTVRRVTRRFIYIDRPRKATIASWWPPRSWGLYHYVKTEPQAVLAVYPTELYGRLRAVAPTKGTSE